MIAEAIEKIIQIAKPTIQKVDRKLYADRSMIEIGEEKPHVERLKLAGLPGLVDIVKHEALLYASETSPIFVEVESPTEVRVFDSVDKDLERDHWYRSEADVPGCRNGYRSYEEFVIELRSKFVPSPGQAYLLDLFSRMDITEKSSSEDNGITQQVIVRQGVALKDVETVRPIVALTPYRTFFEADQPESEFLIRVDREGMIGIFEADGGMWRQMAKCSVAAWLEEQLAAEIDEGLVRVLR